MHIIPLILSPFPLATPKRKQIHDVQISPDITEDGDHRLRPPPSFHPQNHNASSEGGKPPNSTAAFPQKSPPSRPPFSFFEFSVAVLVRSRSLSSTFCSPPPPRPRRPARPSPTSTSRTVTWRPRSQLDHNNVGLERPKSHGIKR